MEFSELPEEIWIQILSVVEAKTLAASIPLVCSNWLRLTEDLLFWLQRLTYCRIKISPNRRARIKEKWNDPAMRIAVKAVCLYADQHKFNQNLVSNPYFVDGLSQWKISERGVKPIIEDPPVGAPPIPIDVGHPNAKCFVTSYRPCQKSQQIPLYNFKILPHMIEQLRPTIRISEWATSRFDCNSWCELILSFETKKGRPLLSKILRTNLTENEWIKIKIVIPSEDISPALANITYGVRSADSAFWKGHYGAKTTGSCLVFDIESDQ